MSYIHVYISLRNLHSQFNSHFLVAWCLWPVPGKTLNLSLELNLICEFYSNIASQSFAWSAALALWAESQPVKCFGISVRGLTHQKQSEGLQRRRTVSTAPFMFCSGSLQFHVSQQQARQKDNGANLLLSGLPSFRQWSMLNSVFDGRLEFNRLRPENAVRLRLTAAMHRDT